MLNSLLSAIGQGANIFILIAVILLALVAGISATDYIRQKQKEKEYEEE